MKRRNEKKKRKMKRGERREEGKKRIRVDVHIVTLILWSAEGAFDYG